MLKLSFDQINICSVKSNLETWQIPSAGWKNRFDSLCMKIWYISLLSPIGKTWILFIWKSFISFIGFMCCNASKSYLKFVGLFGYSVIILFQASINRVCSFELNYSSFEFIAISSGLWQLTSTCPLDSYWRPRRKQNRFNPVCQQTLLDLLQNVTADMNLYCIYPVYILYISHICVILQCYSMANEPWFSFRNPDVLLDWMICTEQLHEWTSKASLAVKWPDHFKNKIFAWCFSFINNTDPLES